ncbi:MAG: tol-pal system protein YbgF [Nitrospirota bacterium]
MKITSYSIFLCFFLIVSCAPQAELVRTKSDLSDIREEVKATSTRIQEIQKRLNTVEANVDGTVDVQKNMADYGAKSDQLATDIQLVQGKLEENNFRIAELAQKLDDRSFKITELSAKIEELEEKIKVLSAGTGTVKTIPASANSSPSQSSKIEPSDLYRQAKNDFDKKDYDLALAGFQNYLARFPKASQADKAQYWVGECYYVKKNFDKAIDAFSKVITSYPNSDKVAGAKLKIGYSYLNERNNSKARDYLNKVIKEHPTSKESALAKDKLKKIGR